MNNKAIMWLEKIKLKCAKMHVFENTKIWNAAKSPYIFISGLPNLNSFHFLTRDTKGNNLKQKIKIDFFDKYTIFDQK